MDVTKYKLVKFGDIYCTEDSFYASTPFPREWINIFQPANQKARIEEDRRVLGVDITYEPVMPARLLNARKSSPSSALNPYRSSHSIHAATIPSSPHNSHPLASDSKTRPSPAETDALALEAEDLHPQPKEPQHIKRIEKEKEKEMVVLTGPPIQQIKQQLIRELKAHSKKAPKVKLRLSNDSQLPSELKSGTIVVKDFHSESAFATGTATSPSSTHNNWAQFTDKSTRTSGPRRVFPRGYELPKLDWLSQNLVIDKNTH
jgi:hypothetical protein